MNQEIYVIIALAAILTAAGSAATCPFISALAIGAAFTAVSKGELWEEKK